MSPSSSPGGSPSASSFIDSSPLPSSPSLQPIDLGRPPTPLGISHPFAGSTHATTHPSHELRYSNSSYTPATWAYRPDITSTADRTKVLESFFDEEEGFSTSSFDPEPPDEATLWEERITRAVDTGDAEFTWKYVSIPLSLINIVYSPSLKRCRAYLCAPMYRRAQQPRCHIRAHSARFQARTDRTASCLFVTTSIFLCATRGPRPDPIPGSHDIFSEQ
jgi:hypothetical protein